MAKAPPSFQFFPADFMVGTAGLSHSSKATYLLLLCYEWTQKNVRFEPSRLAKMIGISEAEFAQDWSELKDKFTIKEDGCIYNDRLETIRQEALALSDARKNAGRKGGLSKAKAKLKQKGWQKVSKGSLKSEVCSMKFKDKEKEMDEQFELFWSFARIKAGKARARKHYEQAITSMNGHADPHGYLLDRWKLYQQSARGQSEYAWEPCSWLRDGHYDDDPETWQDKRGKHELDSRNQRIEGNLPAGYGTLRPPG